MEVVHESSTGERVSQGMLQVYDRMMLASTRAHFPHIDASGVGGGTFDNAISGATTTSTAALPSGVHGYAADTPEMAIIRGVLGMEPG
jgi:hypothetical protein